MKTITSLPKKPLKAELMALAEEAGGEISRDVSDNRDYFFRHPLLDTHYIDFRSKAYCIEVKAICIGLIEMREAGELDV